MKYIFTIIIFSFTITLIAQTNLKLQNGTNIKVTGNVDIVLQNTSFENNGTFTATNGEVHLTGNSATNQSNIGGASATTFYNLVLNKTLNDAELGNNITINNQLVFQSGKLVIGSHDLTMGNSASFTGQNKDRYIVTNSTGSLIRQVGNSWTAFPIGNSTFNPARLKNDGTVDNFSIRVVDHFLQNGNSGSAFTSNVVPRTWFIDEETVGGSDISMRLIWRPTHTLGGFAPLNSTVSHYTGGAWQDQGAGSSTQDNTYGSDHRYREATGIMSFSPFGVRTPSNLPVELLYFYAEKEGNNVRLDWQTATELNNSHFDVEWSTDGIEFTKIGQVEGAGTTDDISFYDFLHTSLASDLNYYRLKQVDFDEKFEYTNILSIEYRIMNIEYQIYPNPASDYIVIDGMNEGELVQVFNVNGQMVKEFQIESTNHQLTIDNLPSGTYFVKMNNQVKKLVIQK